MQSVGSCNCRVAGESRRVTDAVMLLAVCRIKRKHILIEQKIDKGFRMNSAVAPLFQVSGDV